ncbi:uncharacterized protein LOC129610830 [Condylostylus longicornis]|uniref:uncharacterized protein LOC129610830 n=1 Tax=Condylostylus longicornis TaxID=2530218 RepID=UPI00244DCB5E|nr:uncharacterized protein LOC129610830 [Condylostylus longicornis]XP_055379557.1 uncharacterized protein LOC129610830 [Condylostylus longicornis]XP_055379558.1 uncharacterized protein LOC129610830 [Condylostylus longicornis]XP_055379559.1 uncharacterized protein LOC129610830 [Condylostylus longicornis]XP_055379560.1 uncharacterized protein LOC129610830 [Condylostylus longicornis]
MFRINLFITYLLLGYGCFINPISGNTYPGLRRRPPQLTSVEETNILTQIVEDLARRRFQQKLVQDQFYNHLSQHNQNGPNPNTILDEDYNSAPGQSFTYEFPEANHEIEPTGKIEFAVNPSDPRYYEGHNKNQISLNDDPLSSGSLAATKNLLNSYDSVITNPNNNFNINKEVNGKGIFANNNNKSVKDILFNKVKPPMDFTSKTTQSLQSLLLPKPFRGRDDIAKLVQKLQQEGKANTVINGNPNSLLSSGQRTQEVVVKERVGDNDVSMYMVALLSGITAAVLVGFMALGIAWITLQRRTKAAADVDYPAYGVTGPNKDLSPSGDKRLAQSAQLYHYQHQKQQIIGMENRQPPEQTTGQSDVESDDDNDEGDYTVYECPGLASTGEMEVKNPLFIDETPVSTPLSTTATTGTITTATTTSTAATNTTDSPKHTQKLQNKPQSQQLQSVKQQPQGSNISSSSSSSSPSSSIQQQQKISPRSQSPNSVNKSPKTATKKEKQPPPTPQRKYKTGNSTTTSTPSQQQTSSTANGQQDQVENNPK